MFNRKAKRWLNGRKNLFQHINEKISRIETSNAQVIWFHCASLGEFEQVRPLIERFRVHNSKLKIIVTFFSPSGYEIRKDFDGAHLVCYLPLDTKANAERFLNLINPSQVFFVKYDFWYNFLCEVHKRKIPLHLVSANFREKQFAGLYGYYLKRTLKFFSKIFVQNESSQKILALHGITNVIVSGDLRFDRVSQVAASAKKIPIIEHFKEGKKLLVCGSVWPKDESLLFSSTIQSYDYPVQKIIIAPHEISESHLQALTHLLSHFKLLRFSEVSKDPISIVVEKLKQTNVLIIDHIGMLSSLYQYADVAYVGGGLGAGIHNILEPVAFGTPVMFGPNHQKFPEAAELIAQGGGFCISNSDTLIRTMKLLLSDDKILKMASMVCKKFVFERKGASERIFSHINITTNGSSDFFVGNA